MKIYVCVKYILANIFCIYFTNEVFRDESNTENPEPFEYN